MSIDNTPLSSNKSPPSILERLKNESYLLAIIPFFGSFLAFIFELGYLQYYEAPITLIQLDFTRIITASGYIALGLTVIIILFEFAINIGKGLHPLYKIISDTLILCILVSSFLVLLPEKPEKWWYIAAIVCYQVVFKLILISPKTSKSETYWDRVSSENNPVKSKSETVEAKAALNFRALLGLILFGSIWVTFLGRSWAADKTFYWVLDDQQDMVLVANYGDTLIFKKIILSTNEITDYIELYKINDVAPIKMSYSQIGRLKDKKNPAIFSLAAPSD